MKLDRNINETGRGKYGVVKVRKLREFLEKAGPETKKQTEIMIEFLQCAGILTFGGVGAEDEFFVLMLKDKYAGEALANYANYAVQGDPEYASEVMQMAKRAGSNNPFCKQPD